jgi:hypothetical protein
LLLKFFSLRSRTLRDASTLLHMTEKFGLAVLITFELVSALALAQESPTAAPTPTASPTRSVRISFVPPPIDGTISLGIYDAEPKLVRVLKQEAEVDEFEIGDDGLSTRWDGKDDEGFDLPAGKYHARGYIVAPMKIATVSLSGTMLPPALEAPLRVALVRNPLNRGETPIVDLDVGHDDENAYIKATDGLPLITVANVGDVESAGFINRSDQIVTVLLRRPGESLLVKVGPISKMMAFDCGDLELR